MSDDMELEEDGSMATIQIIDNGRFTGVTGLGIGICGAHRTGKTTVAKMLARNNNLPLIESPTSKIAAAMGIDFKEAIPFGKRLDFQDEVYRQFEALYKEHRGIFIADRTPLDLAAYLIADIPMDLTDAGHIQRANDYVEKCFGLVNRHFFTLTLIQPGIRYVVEPGKPPPNSAYQEAYNTIIMGLIHDNRFERDVYVLARWNTRLRDRGAAIATSARMALEYVNFHVHQLPAC